MRINDTSTLTILCLQRSQKVVARVKSLCHEVLGFGGVWEGVGFLAASTKSPTPSIYKGLGLFLLATIVLVVRFIHLRAVTQAALNANQMSYGW